MGTKKNTSPGEPLYQIQPERQQTEAPVRAAKLPGVAQTAPRRRALRMLGFQLLEILIAVALVAVLAVIAFPSYQEFVDKGRNATAIADILAIDQAIERFYVRNGALPNSLADVGVGGMLDPWDNPYRYLRIAGSGMKGKGSVRKDRALNPVNSDYDLYSMGKNGDSSLPFTSPQSHDDIVRCNNGRFVGLAADY